MAKLTPKQELFCKEYLVDLNGTQAAIRAGYSQNSAKEIANQHLTKLHIKKYINQLKDKRSAKVEITAEMVLLELAKCGFSNIQDYIKEGFTIEEIKKLNKDHAAAISSVSIETITNDFGEKTNVKFKLHDKLAALEKIAKHIGFFGEDNKQKQTEPQTYLIGGKIVRF